jgi:methylenetetrahydrofolate reductase (NADPH)
MRKLTDIFAERPWTFSFEFFAPKTDKGRANLLEAADALEDLGADFFSVTYGAGGTEAHTTLDTVLKLLYEHETAVVHHLTCVKHTYREIRQQIAGMGRVGVRNIMALRGDPPASEPDFVFGENQPKYAYQLVELIREQSSDWFSVGVAAFPESHPMAPSVKADSQYLRIKQDRGADFAVTQLFFENEHYFSFVERVRKEGVHLRLIPGVLPVTDYGRLLQFCDKCGVDVPPPIRERFEPVRDNPQATTERGIELAVRQCRELLDLGAPGIHFYCLNRAEPVSTIYKRLGV